MRVLRVIHVQNQAVQNQNTHLKYGIFEALHVAACFEEIELRAPVNNDNEIDTSSRLPRVDKLPGQRTFDVLRNTPGNKMIWLNSVLPVMTLYSAISACLPLRGTNPGLMTVAGTLMQD